MTVAEILLPPLYSGPVALNFEQHQKVGVNINGNYVFCAKVGSVPIVAEEITHIMRDMPVVFGADTNGGVIAITGIIDGKNQFVTADEKWTDGVYIPAYIRRYPFIFETTDGKKLSLCIDMEADMVSEKEGSRIFDGEALTPYGKEQLSFCEKYHLQALRTKEFVEELENKNLLVQKDFTITHKSGETTNITGFRLLDEEKFNGFLGKMKTKEFREWHRKGWMIYCYFHLASLNNFLIINHRVSDKAV